jgi:photosystem II stability/assembly factor-like uncharacterized protein
MCLSEVVMKHRSNRTRQPSLYLLTLSLGCLVLIFQNSASAQNHNPAAPNPIAALHFRFVGPIGNRVAAVIGEPGNPNVVYIGAADGGIWKTEDGGATWKPIFDKADVSPVGALAMAPSEHNIVWAGTGEPWLIRPFWALGNGVYKSTDAGESWQNMGLDATGHIARIVIDPHDPNRVFVCAIGQTFLPQQQRGVFRTLDGGKTWQQVLFINENTGCSDLAMDPSDPNTLFAGMWPVTIHTWGIDSGGAAGGVYATHDGGATWHKLSGHGLPANNHPVGKVAVAIAQSNPKRVYALIQDNPPGLYRSDDGGQTWKLVNQSHIPDERAPYYTRFTVAPDNENLLYFVSVAYSFSPDGGKTLLIPGSRHSALGQASGGGDNHDLWIDPTNSSRILVANDEGVNISNDHGRSFANYVLPISQVYHVAVDNDIPYHVMGNLQDRDSFRGPSRALSGGFFDSPITPAYFTTTGGCEDGFAVPDPKNANVVWAGCDNGHLDRMDWRTRTARDVTPWPVSGLGWAPKDMKYRWHWSFPIAIDPLDHHRVYVGAQVVFMTTDGGQSWKVISPDLTTNNKSHQENSGGISFDNLVTFDGSTLYSIAPSAVKEGVLWVGSNDGQVSVTKDGGAHWTNVTANIPNLPPWGTVANIEPSHFDPATAYIAVNLQLVGDYNPYVYKTTDYGQSWKLISASVPRSVNSSANCIVEDPIRKGMLYLGTENAIFVTWDDGGEWTRLHNNFPPAPVQWLAIQPTFNDLVVGTYGRGVWILDDVTPLRALDRARGKPTYFFKPRPAYRFRNTTDAREIEPSGHVVGENPPYGADLDFWLAGPQKNVKLSVLGPGNETIRTVKIKKTQAGINRVWWDLRYDSGTKIRFQTPPPDALWANPHRGYRAYGAVIPGAGAIVPPGTYTVQLKAAGQTFTRPLEVLPDPHSPGTQQSIEAQVKFELEVRSESNQVAGMINHIEWTRKQLADLQSMLGAHGDQYATVIEAAKQLASKAVALEGQMIDVHNTGRSEDVFRHPMELYGRLCWLITPMNGAPGSGSGGSDMAPTTQDVAVNDQFEAQIAQLQPEFDRLVHVETPAFNRLLKQNHLTLAIQP